MREALSHSRIGVLLSCQQKYRWQYEERLEPAVKKASLQMGAAFAHALEVADPQAGFQMVIDERDALSEEHGGNPWVVVPSRDDAEVDATIVLAASGTYLAHYGTTDVEREVTMRCRLVNPDTGGMSQTFDLTGRVDALAGDRIIEDKLLGRVDQITERRLMLDRQVTIGAYLLWRTRDLIPSEVSYRITKKPGIRRRQGESHAEFLHRIVRDYQERPDVYLHEFTLTRSREDFERLERELWQWAEQIRAARRFGVFPRNTSACAEYGGCPWIALCSDEPGAIHQFVERPEFVMSEEQEAVA